MRYFRLLCYTIALFFFNLFSHHDRLLCFVNRSLCDDNFFNVFFRRNLKHKFEQHVFQNRSQTSCARIELDRLCSHRSQCVILKFKRHAVKRKLILVLFDKRVFRFGKNLDECVFVKSVESDDNRHTSDKFGDKTKSTNAPPQRNKMLVVSS